MSAGRAVQTANQKNSIWKPISEDEFRRNMIRLSKASAEVPQQQKYVWSIPSAYLIAQPSSSVRLLSLDKEQRLADDFAFIAAAKQGASKVAAVCIEETEQHTGLIVRVAANDGVDEDTKAGLENICNHLSNCTKNGTSVRDCISRVSYSMMQMVSARILDRMCCFLFQKPSFDSTNTLPTESPGLRNTLMKMRRAALNSEGRNLVDELIELISVFRRVLNATSMGNEPENLILELQTIVRRCFELTTKHGKMTFRETLIEAGLEPIKWFNNKWIMQIDKLAAYWRIPDTIVREAYRKNSRILFSNITIECVDHFISKRSSISLDGNTVPCHVHAEIQLVVHYDMAISNILNPRVIGTSKAACFLCDSFIVKHGQFCTSTTHGRLYDQWTIPDLREYQPRNLVTIRKIIQLMNTEFVRLANKNQVARLHPLTSRHNLPYIPIYTPLSSINSTNQNVTLHRIDESVAHMHIVELNSSPFSRTTPRAGLFNESFSRLSQNGRACLHGHIRSDISVTEGKIEAAVSASPSNDSFPSLLSDEHDLSPTKPFLLSTPKLKIMVEIEAPRTGTVSVNPSSREHELSGDSTIEVAKLKVGEDIGFQRNENESSLTLDFKNEDGKQTRISLSWL